MLVVRFRNSGVGERLGHLNDRVMPILQRKLDGGITNATSIDASFDIHSPGLHVRLAAMVKLQILRQLGSFLPYPRKFCDGWAVFCPIPASVAIVGQFFAQFPQVLRRVGSLLPCSRKFCEMPALQV